MEARHLPWAFASLAPALHRPYDGTEGEPPLLRNREKQKKRDVPTSGTSLVLFVQVLQVFHKDPIISFLPDWHLADDFLSLILPLDLCAKVPFFGAIAVLRALVPAYRISSLVLMVIPQKISCLLLFFGPSGFPFGLLWDRLNAPIESFSWLFTRSHVVSSEFFSGPAGIVYHFALGPAQYSSKILFI